MGKIAVIPPGDGKHPNEIEGHSHGDGGPAPSDPDHAEAHQMDGDDGDTSEPVHARRSVRLHMFESRPGIYPTKNGEPQIPGFAGMQDTHVGHSNTSKVRDCRPVVHEYADPD